MPVQCPLCGSFAHSRAVVDNVEVSTCLTCEASWSEGEDGVVNIKPGTIPAPTAADLAPDS